MPQKQLQKEEYDSADGFPQMFHCFFCPFKTINASSQLDHISSHDKNQPWDCERCALDNEDIFTDVPHDPNCWTYPEDESLDDEDEDDDGGSAFVETDDHSVSCTLCPFQNNKVSMVLEHINLHIRGKGQHNKAEVFRTGPPKRLLFPSFYCTECEFSCVLPQKLEAHMTTVHSPGAVFPCRYCEFVGATKKLLSAHVRTHSLEKPYGCPECPAKFTRLDNLKMHQTIHSGERPFCCSMCPYTATNKWRMIVHYNVHKGQDANNHPAVCCPVCQVPFTNYSFLNLHRQKHTLLPPYICAVCEKTMTSSNELFDHHSEHIDSVSLACPYCPFKCFNDTEVHAHLKASHRPEKPFQCNLCDYRFATIVHWKRHQLVHTGEKPFACDLCPARFSQAGNRKGHMIKVHRIDVPALRKRK